MRRLHNTVSTALRRRDLLRIGLAAGLGVLGGCAGRAGQPLLRAAPETLPALWRRRLPWPWRFEPLAASSSSILSGLSSEPPADLLALSDGWLAEFTVDDLQPIVAAPLRERLGEQARRFLGQLTPALAARLLPVAVSPWVMCVRGSDLGAAAAEQGWDVLLDPRLHGAVVLPESPRLVMALADRIDRPDSLVGLRRAALTLDDRHALNWLLQGKGKVAVLPLQRCLQTLRHDPRLHAVLPETGAPLHWTLLLQPAASLEPLPQAWVEAAWQAPLIGQLLARGWRAPLRSSELLEQRQVLPGSDRSLVLPPAAVWHRCWSLPPLQASDQAALSRDWQDAAP